jgi:SAM-dependent methyltransferase
MIEKAVGSFAEFYDIVSAHQSEWWCWYYRGHSKLTYRLVPKAGRDVFAANVVGDRNLFETWMRHAVPYLPGRPRDLSEWDMLAIAQHHGLATRLLDWSFNALNAAFFAIVNSDGQIDETHDSAVFAHYSLKAVVGGESMTKSPFEFEGIHRVAPSSVSPRIGRQGGIFTLHGPPSRSLEESMPAGDSLEKIVIKAAAKKAFAIQLSHFGVNRMSLFPDLDGLSCHLNWSFTNLPYSELRATKSFYEREAKAYATETQELPLDHLWDAFGKHLAPNASILDLGCGAGRDLKEFVRRGYQVVGVDYSAPLAEIAKRHSGQRVEVASFDEMQFDKNSFDGVWAVASLLHVPRKNVADILKKVHDILKPGGILLTSMQKGTGKQFSREARLFEMYGNDEWEAILGDAGLEVIEREETCTRLMTAGDDREITWIAHVCRKSAGPPAGA